MRRFGLALVAVVVPLAGLIGFRIAAAPTTVSSSNSDVTVECDSSVAAGDCTAWGDAILRAGAPSHTFEIEDLERLELTRSMFGFGATCHAAYFIGRYPGDAVWTNVVTCPSPDADS